jgi:uncharacterized protein (TIGR00288 family)
MVKEQKTQKNVAILVDYENIHVTLHKFFDVNHFDVTNLPAEIRKIGEEYGRVVFAKAYGDWTTRTKAIITAFGMNLIECKHVFPKVSGQDRSDISVVIDAMELLFTKHDIDNYVLFSGDSDFRELAIKIESKGKNIIVCSFSTATSEDLKKAAGYDFIPLEDRLNLNLRGKNMVSPDPINWRPLVKSIAYLKNWNFIGWSTYRNKYLAGIYPEINWHDYGSQDEVGNKDNFLEKAVSEGIIEKYKAQYNGSEVAAIRLNVDDEIVKEVLSKK